MTIEPPTAEVPEPDPPRAMVRMDAVSSAKTLIEPASLVAAEVSIEAVTVVLMTLTATETPTAALVPPKAIPPARLRIEDESLAWTTTSPATARTVELDSIVAETVLVMTLTLSEPPTPGPSLTPIPAPMAALTILPPSSSSLSTDVALTVTLAPVMEARAIRAVVRVPTMLNATAIPTPACLSPRPRAPATDWIREWSMAMTETGPNGTRRVASSTVASTRSWRPVIRSSAMRLTATVPPTAAPPDPPVATPAAIAKAWMVLSLVALTVIASPKWAPVPLPLSTSMVVRRWVPLIDARVVLAIWL